MNKPEQTFATALKNQLIKQKFPFNALIEVKVAEEKSFYPKDLRKSQKAVINKFTLNIPLAHKISDSSVGSKFVDLIYINPLANRTEVYVAIKFMQSKKWYLVPTEFIQYWTTDNAPAIPEYLLSKFLFKRVK